MALSRQCCQKIRKLNWVTNGPVDSFVIATDLIRCRVFDSRLVAKFSFVIYFILSKVGIALFYFNILQLFVSFISSGSSEIFP